MKIETANERTVHLSISESNLRGLLDDFDRNNWARIQRTDIDAGTQMAITVENDEKHYRGRREYTGMFPLGQAPDDREAGLN